MNLVGYLITLANLQSFQDSGGPLKDISIKVSEVQKLVNELKRLPEFSLEGFKQTGYYRVGNVGKYLSKNLRDYIYNGKVNPKDEGIVLTLQFTDQDATPAPATKNDEDLSFFFHKNTKVSDEVKNGIIEHLDGVKRDKRSLLNKITDKYN